MALSAIAYFIMQSIDIIILSVYEGFDQIAYYSVCKLAMVTTLALMSVNIVIAPSAEIFEKKNMNDMQLLIKHSTGLFFISICVLAFYFYSQNKF